MLLYSGVRARQRHRLKVGCLKGSKVGRHWASKSLYMRPSRLYMRPSRLTFRFRVGHLARHNHNQAPSQRFNILYFGRDEFSCQVLEELYTATGSTFFSLHPPRIDASGLADVWQNLLIATQPDQMIGRKRDILSVRQSPHLLSIASFSFKRVASSVENPEQQT